MVGPLTAYTAAQPHLTHHLQNRLISDTHPFLSAQAHSHLPVTAPVGGPRKNLGNLGPQIRSGWLLGVSQRVVVARPGKASSLKEVVQLVTMP